MAGARQRGGRRIHRWVLAALLGAALLPRTALAWSDPEWAAMGSLFLPGVGQLLNKDWVEGGTQIGLTFVISYQYLILTNQSAYLQPKEQVDSKNHFINTNRTTFDAGLYGTALNDLTFYSSFAAYRDARNARHNQGYATPAPQESATDLAVSPFSWDLLRRPTTFIPMAVALYSAVTPASDGRYVYKPDRTIDRNTLQNGAFVTSEMVAIGEEAFFRGFLNNGLSDSLGPYWGLGLSSGIFGLAHEGVGGQATALGATLFGLYLGWLQQRNDYDIREGVAIHFWWDFLVSLGMLKQRHDKATEFQLMHVDWRF